MITNRSNHMPIFTKMLITTIIHGVVRIVLLQKNCGAITLQLTIVQYAQAYGPKARFRNVNPS